MINYSNRQLRNMKATNIIENSDGSESVVYHSTRVVTKDKNGNFILNSGGYETVTTKRRMNQFTPNGIYVSQCDFVWYVNGVPFFDGIMVSPTGTVLNPGDAMLSRCNRSTLQF